MTGDRVRYALAAVLAVLVVATAAAAVETPGANENEGEATSDEGLGMGNGSGMGRGNGSGFGFQLPENLEPTDSPVLSTLLQRFITAVLAFSLIAPLVYAAVVLWQEGVRALLVRIAYGLLDLLAIAAFMLGMALLLYLLSHLTGNGGGGSLGSGDAAGGLDGSGGPVDVQFVPDVPVGLLLVAVLLLVVLAGAYATMDDPIRSLVARAAAVRSRSGRELRPTSGAGVGPVDTPDFTDVEPTNEVYRVWRDLAESSEAVPLSTLTAAEVRTRAVEAGLDDEQVSELTALFREVRYNRQPATEEREHRARAIWARLRGDTEDGNEDRV